MAERVVAVRLTAQVADYKRAMKEAAQETEKLGTASERVAKYRAAFEAAGRAGLLMGSVMAAGLGVAVAKFAEFDAAMSSVQAATHESAENMDLLREAALDAGASTVFSATEAASAIEELAKAGVSTADILNGGLNGALNLAAAGGLQVADAAGIAATALKLFNLEGDDMSHVADLLAAGAGKAMGDVGDLSQALNQAGLVANQTGLSIEETTAGLAAFAEQGLLGSDAGTSFKAMLQRLTPQSAEAAKLMEQLGISAYDAQGNFVGLSEFAGNLRGALEPLTTEQRNSAMATIFGSDAVRAASVIYAQGEEGIRQWTEAVDDQGYAAETARMRLDNLKGDLEALGGAFETALIESGSAANDTLRTMVQALTGLVDMYNGLPPEVQGAVTAVGGATAAIALSSGAAFTAIPKFLELKNTVKDAGWSMKGLSLTAGAAGLALGGLFMIVGNLAAQHQQAQALAQSYAETIEETTGTVSDAARKIAFDELSKAGDFLSFNWQSAYDAAEKLGVSIDTLTDAATGNESAMAELKPYYDALAQGGDALNAVMEETGLSAYEARFALEAMINGVENQNTAIGRAIELKGQEEAANATTVTSAGTATEAYLAEGQAVDDLNSQIDELIQRINGQNDVHAQAISANAAYQDALAGLSAVVESNGTSLDEATAAGSANAATLAELAGKAQDAAAAQFEVDRTTMSAKDATDKYRNTLASQRQAFIDSAVQAGYNADEVKKLADRIFQMPSEKEFQALVDTTQAQSKIDHFVTLNNGRRVKVYVDTVGNQSFKVGSKTVSAFSRGGRVLGPGTSTSDDVPALLSTGEHVLTAAEVRAMGGHDRVEKWRAMMMTAGRTAEILPEVMVKAPPLDRLLDLFKEKVK